MLPCGNTVRASPVPNLTNPLKNAFQILFLSQIYKMREVMGPHANEKILTPKLCLKCKFIAFITFITKSTVLGRNRYMETEYKLYKPLFSE